MSNSSTIRFNNPLGEDLSDDVDEPDIKHGLSPAVAAQRLLEDGPNELEKPPRISLLTLFIIQLNSVIMYLLMAAVVASAAIKATGDNADDILSYIDSIAIFIIVLINATIAAVTENNANDALEALSSLQSPMCTVIRGGEESLVESRDLVTGDVVKLSTGDVVPADIRVISANDFRVNEMLLTGEPEDVAKSPDVKPSSPGQPEKLTAENMAYSSCNVKAGAAVGVVVATGMNTRVGTIASLLNDDGSSDEPAGALSAEDLEKGIGAASPKKKQDSCLPDTKAGQTPLQENLELLAVKIGYMAIAVCVIVFVVGLALGTKDPEDPDSQSWLFMVLVAVTLTVAAIPEGLPLCVTIALSSGCSSMVKEHVLMRKIAAVETLGSASIICTDKTGTLTEGKMTLVAMHTGKTDYKVTGKGFDPTDGTITARDNSESVANDDACVRATLGSAVLCSNTTLKLEEDEASGQMRWTPRGNSSEAPLVVAGHKIGIKLEELEASLERVAEIPFSSSRKMMVTVTKTVAKSDLGHVGDVGEHTGHIKGAPNYILDKCTTFLEADGSITPMKESDKARFLDKVDELSSQALRVLAIATRPLGHSLPFEDDAETEEQFSKIVDGLTLCGLCASIDPERDGVKDAVCQSKTAGVRVVMITGDYLMTAIAIAKNIGILDADTFEDNGEATDCGALRPTGDGSYISNSEIDAMTRRTSVFARAKPEDKLEIVKSLQRQGWVCAMTGDGVNDAPALHRADIGVAMGLEGTEVAKGASDMILTDDNFCSIVKAIEKGRVIYSGIQKFVSFIMSVHLAEVVQIFCCIVVKIPVMRQPLQILFLILVTDLPPSIALGFEPGEALTMQRPPRPKTQPVVMGWMWRGIVANALILTVCIFCTYLLALWAYAGAFLSEDITDITRTHCAIWDHSGGFHTPHVKIDCGLWTACSNTTGAEGYHAGCATWQTQTAYAAADEKLLADAVVAAHLADGAIYTPHGNQECEVCIDTSIRRARTCAFIALVWAENFRAYSSRSFENGVWVGMFSNPYMNKAIIMAQVSLYTALWLPGLNEDVLGLYVSEIHGFGWAIAFCGAFACLVFCELYKFAFKSFESPTKIVENPPSSDSKKYIVEGTPEADMADQDFDLVMNRKLAQNEYPAAELEAARAADHTSLCAQFCTPEIWKQYKDKVSSGPAKWTLARAINTGVRYPSSFVGCHAGDSGSYDDFKDFFYPVIQAYHKGFDIERTKHVTDMDPAKISTTLSDSAQAKIISTRIRLARNLAMFPLNPGANKDTRPAICDMMQKVYASIDPAHDLAGEMFRHTTMSDEQRQGLIDDHFLFRGKDKMQAASGYHEYWPEGRGVYHNRSKTFVNWLNEGDHLRIISMEQGGDVLRVFTRLAEGAKMIEEGIKQETGETAAFMMHPIFGSLTCCPSNIGTGMRGSVHILVPKLIDAIGFEAIDKMCRERNCQARGSSGEHSEVIDRIDVSNWRRIGFPEYELVHDMIKCANFLAEEEDKL